MGSQQALCVADISVTEQKQERVGGLGSACHSSHDLAVDQHVPHDAPTWGSAQMSGDMLHHACAPSIFNHKKALRVCMATPRQSFLGLCAAELSSRQCELRASAEFA